MLDINDIGTMLPNESALESEWLLFRFWVKEERSQESAGELVVVCSGELLGLSHGVGEEVG